MRFAFDRRILLLCSARGLDACRTGVATASRICPADIGSCGEAIHSINCRVREDQRDDKDARGSKEMPTKPL